MSERRAIKRRNFCYYMRVLEDANQQTVGYLADITPRGFRLDSSQAWPEDKEMRLRVELTSDVSPKTHIVFQARSKWCRPDTLDPFSFNIGFEIVNISSGDGEIFQRIVEKYALP